MPGEHNHCHAHDHVTHDRRMLWIVLILNAFMFFLELWQGLKADSSALLADSMDFFSDSLSYVITLYVIQKHIHIRAKAALIKASLMLVLAGAALTQGVYNLIEQATPIYSTMGWVGTLALVVNIASALLLYSSRGRDSNMHSVWLCSRNDAFANILILCAAYLVYITSSPYPDLAVALGIAWLEGHSALKIIAHAKSELK